MTTSAKYILCNFFDYLLTWGGTLGVIVYNYVVPDNSLGFKITLTGILLVIVTVFFLKASFEKHYREKLDNLLQQLATVTNEEDKAKINEKITAHKIKNNVYQRLMLLLPFIVLFVVSWLGEVTLGSLRGTTGLILMSIGGGSIFNIIKKPLKDKLELEKLTK